MNCDLLVCVKVQREKFEIEEYKGDEDIIALVENGTFWFDDNEVQQVAEPLDAVVFKKGRLYHRKILDKATMYLFRYKSNVEIFSESKISFKSKERIRSTLQLLNMADSCVHSERFEYKRSLFSDILTQYMLENSCEINNTGDELIQNAIDKINNNLHRKINLAKLADESFLSYVQFARRFKSVVGMSAQDYISAMRMNNAEQMLRNTDLSVKSISLGCGFANEYYFSNFFKKYYGYSPTQYRQMLKNS